jgi:hypothetical protein
LILKGGHVIDPANNHEAVKDMLSREPHRRSADYISPSAATGFSASRGLQDWPA